MSGQKQSMIDPLLIEEIQQLREEIEQLKQKNKSEKNNSNLKGRKLKSEQKWSEHLEDMIFSFAQAGKIPVTTEVCEVLERVEKRKGIKLKKSDQSEKERPPFETELEEENDRLREENGKLKNQLRLDSSNSSLPPSSDEVRALGRKGHKRSNEYNSRKKSGRKKGAQKGHPFRGLGVDDLSKLLEDGKVELLTEDHGKPDGSSRMITRYVLDLMIVPVICEHHFYGEEPLPKELSNKVSYGNTLRSIAVMLEADGLLSIERTRDFLNHLCGGAFKISTGTVYNILNKFSEAAMPEYEKIIDHLKNSHVLYTDQTKFKVDGKSSYVRNHSTERAVLYQALTSKRIEEVKQKSPVLSQLDEQTVLVHDHEVGLYHFLSQHSECHVHLKRDLRRVEEETGHKWCKSLSKLIWETVAERNELIERGETGFDDRFKEDFVKAFEKILEEGREEYEKAFKSKSLLQISLNFEKCVLNRLRKPVYRQAYLKFIDDFQVRADNNLSERDLRKVVVKRKQIGTYRDFSGLELFCRNLSITESIKKEGSPLFDTINHILSRSAPSLTLK